MGQTAKPTRHNRTITVDFHDETTSFALLSNTKACVECVLALLLSRGFPLLHKGSCSEGSCLPRQAHYVQVWRGGLPIWRIQCTRCKAVFTVLPHVVLRYRQRRPDMARDALVATHGGLSLAWGAVLCTVSPMALYRLVCALGHQSLVTVLTRGRLPLPVSFLAEEKPSTCLTDTGYLPAIVRGRVLWHLGYTEHASAAAFPVSYRVFQRTAVQQAPPIGSGASCRMAVTARPAVGGYSCQERIWAPACAMRSGKLPKKRAALLSPVRKAFRSPCHTWLSRARQCKGVRVFARGQRLRHVADHVAHRAGTAIGARVRRWFQAKKAGWSAVLADPQRPVTSTLLEQAQNAMERKLFLMKGFHHPPGSQQAFLTGLAHLYNLLPYQRRAQHAGRCGVAGEGGRVPTADWMLNLHILTCGGMWDILPVPGEVGNSACSSSRQHRLMAMHNTLSLNEIR